MDKLTTLTVVEVPDDRLAEAERAKRDGTELKSVSAKGNNVYDLAVATESMEQVVKEDVNYARDLRAKLEEAGVQKTNDKNAQDFEAYAAEFEKERRRVAAAAKAATERDPLAVTKKIQEVNDKAQVEYEKAVAKYQLPNEQMIELDAAGVVSNEPQTDLGKQLLADKTVRDELKTKDAVVYGQSALDAPTELVTTDTEEQLVKDAPTKDE